MTYSVSTSLCVQHCAIDARIGFLEVPLGAERKNYDAILDISAPGRVSAEDKDKKHLCTH